MKRQQTERFRSKGSGKWIEQNFKFIRAPVLKKGQEIHDSNLVFPGIDDRPINTVHLKRAEVNRIEYHKESGFRDIFA